MTQPPGGRSHGAHASLELQGHAVQLEAVVRVEAYGANSELHLAAVDNHAVPYDLSAQGVEIGILRRPQFRGRHCQSLAGFLCSPGVDFKLSHSRRSFEAGRGKQSGAHRYALCRHATVLDCG